MTTGTYIRAFAQDDLEPLTTLWITAWQQTFPAIDFSARRDFIARELTGAGSGHSEVLVACGSEGERIGFLILKPQASSIEQLVVASSHQGKGVANELLAEARTRCPEGLTLEVNSDNARAIWFYTREGFVVESQAINPNSGLPTLRMRWTPA